MSVLQRSHLSFSAASAPEAGPTRSRHLTTIRQNSPCEMEEDLFQ